MFINTFRFFFYFYLCLRSYSILSSGQYGQNLAFEKEVCVQQLTIKHCRCDAFVIIRSLEIKIGSPELLSKICTVYSAMPKCVGLVGARIGSRFARRPRALLSPTSARAQHLHQHFRRQSVEQRTYLSNGCITYTHGNNGKLPYCI